MTGFSRKRWRAGAIRSSTRSHDAWQDCGWRFLSARLRSRRHYELHRTGRPVYQAGTLSGNPCNGRRPGHAKSFDRRRLRKIGATTDALVSGIMAVGKHAVPLSENHVCGMFGFSFDDHVTNYDHVATSKVEHFNAFFHEMLAQGIYLAPRLSKLVFYRLSTAKLKLNARYTQPM